MKQQREQIKQYNGIQGRSRHNRVNGKREKKGYLDLNRKEGGSKNNRIKMQRQRKVEKIEG